MSQKDRANGESDAQETSQAPFFILKQILRTSFICHRSNKTRVIIFISEVIKFSVWLTQQAKQPNILAGGPMPSFPNDLATLSPHRNPDHTPHKTLRTNERKERRKRKENLRQRESFLHQWTEENPEVRGKEASSSGWNAC